MRLLSQVSYYKNKNKDIVILPTEIPDKGFKYIRVQY